MLALVFTLAVAAPPLVDDEEYRAAVAAYHDLDFQTAADAFARMADEDRPPHQRALLLVWKGLSHAQKNELDVTRAAFEQATLLDPEVEIPVLTSPKIVALFQEARATSLTGAAATKEPPPVEEPPAATAPPSTTTSPTPAATTTPPTTTTARPTAEPGHFPWVSTLVAVGGGVLGATSLVLGAIGGVSYAMAADPTTPQPDAKASVDAANAFLTAAVASGAIGVLLLSGGLSAILLDTEQQ